MAYFFAALQTALLAVIAVELFVLARALPRLVRRLPKDRSDALPKGQTINVNVGTPLVGPPPPEAQNQPSANSIAAPQAAASAQETASEAVPEKTEAELERERRIEERARLGSSAPSARAGSGHPLNVKKCPKCGAENTAMRAECFNCGGSL